MRGRGVEVVVELLDVFAVVAFAAGQPEEPLFEDRVLAVPQGQGKAEALLVVADAGDAVFAPAVGAAAGVVVGEIIPGGRRRRCNPREPFPTAARSGKAPTCANPSGASGPVRGDDVPGRMVVVDPESSAVFSREQGREMIATAGPSGMRQPALVLRANSWRLEIPLTIAQALAGIIHQLTKTQAKHADALGQGNPGRVNRV